MFLRAITGLAHSVFRSFLGDRKQCCRMDVAMLANKKMQYWDTPRIMHGNLSVSNSHNVPSIFCADCTVLFLSDELSYTEGWFQSNRPFINVAITQTIIVGLRSKLDKLKDPLISFPSSKV